MIERWWAKWSVWLLAGAGTVAELAQYLPEVQQQLPEGWYAKAFWIVLVARVIKQQGGKNDPQQ